MPRAKLTHVRADGKVRMVDVGKKPPSLRFAKAEARLRIGPKAFRALKTRTVKKGDALATAEIAGVLAAKRTSELIPLCHHIALTNVVVEANLLGKDTAIVTSTASCTGPTGVEMEALTGAAVAALTIYDMCKALDRGMTIECIRLCEKSGGKSGTYKR